MAIVLALASCGEESEGSRPPTESPVATAEEEGGSREETVSDEETIPGDETYAQILTGLEKAASSNTGYEAAKRAETLEPFQLLTLRKFCHFVWQIKANFEESKLGDRRYILDRIVSFAAYQTWTTKRFTAKVWAATKRLDETIDVASIRPADLNRYLKACYR